MNDINGELINLYRCLKYHHSEVIKEMQWALHSCELLNELNVPVRKGMTDIQRAGRFYALNKLAFGARMHRSNFGYCRQHRQPLVRSTIIRDIDRMNERLDGVCIENTDWQDCIRRYDSKDTLFYCDPPYYGTAGYGVEFGIEQYQEMADLARSIKGKIVISVNDIPEMRDIFNGLTMDRLEILYSLSSTKTSKRSGELLIRNY